MKEHFLTILRNNETKTPAFRSAANTLAILMAQEAVKDLALEKLPIVTPLAPTSGATLKEGVILATVLRAGLVFIPPFLSFFPNAAIGLFGIRRNEKTALPNLYYENLPEISKTTHIFLLDPMLATGGTAAISIQKLIEKGGNPSRISLVSLLAAKPGVELIQKKFPKVRIHTAAVDPELNAKKFIVPGLGDFGDRYFGT